MAVSAANASFELVPPRNVEEGRNFALTFRLTNSEANAPQAPELENCTLLFGPATSTMQSTEIINGRMSSTYTIDYTFTYRADKAGRVTVPSLAVRTQDGTLRSREGAFTILPPDSRSQSSGAQAQPDNRADRRANSGREISADDLLVRVFFSKSSVYEQEPVVATIKIYTNYSISAFMPKVQPAFEGFLMEELPVSSETTREHYNGRNYYCAELKKLLLYPQRSGRLTLNSGKYDVTIIDREPVNMGFFQTWREVERDVTTASNAASITVKPLPTPRPADFSGAVGSFTASATLDPELMRTNDASEYSYVITGTGNIKFIPQMQLTFPVGFDALAPRSEAEASVSNGGTNMTGTYTLRYTLVPQEVGNYTIKGTPLVYFNPSDGKYHTAEVPDMDVRVLRGTSTGPAEARPDATATIDDILYIHRLGDETGGAGSFTIDKAWYWILYGIAALVLVIVSLLYARELRLRGDISGRRLAKAGKEATKRLRKAAAALKAGQDDAFYEAMSAAMWGYLGDKLSMQPSQLTRENIAGKLADAGVSQDIIDRVLGLLDQFEMARFTPDSGSAAIKREAYDNASRVIAAIENSKIR